MNYPQGKMDPNWAKCMKSGQNFLEVGKNYLFMLRSIRNLLLVNLGPFKPLCLGL